MDNKVSEHVGFIYAYEKNPSPRRCAQYNAVIHIPVII